MERYFNIPIEFDRNIIEKRLKEKSILDKGYCCFVDSNLLVMAYKHYLGVEKALNNSFLNSCDGSYIALLASQIYKKKYEAYNGPELFNKFIYYSDIQCIIGNTPVVFNKIKSKVIKEGHKSNLYYIPLPYLNVDEFDYMAIANMINLINPRYIWVSLGAPKQEIFMFKLLPFINCGVMLGVGAALNYFSGEVKDIPYWAIKFHLIWLFRILTEPKKQILRSVKILYFFPSIYLLERKLFRSGKINKI